MITLVNSKIKTVIAISAPKSIFGADLKNALIFFVAHLVFEISVCFGFQLASLPQGYEQQKVALFYIAT